MVKAGSPKPQARPRTNLPVSDRLLESLWGILIVLSVTGSSALVVGATARQIFLIGFVTALAWGVVEAVMDLLRRQLDRALQARMVADPDGLALSEALRDSPLQHLLPEDQATIGKAILEAAKRAPAPDLHLRRSDLWSSVETGVALWSATLPVLAPFLVLGGKATALALSQAIAVAILFGLGAAWGRFSGQKALRTGTLMALLGLGLSALLEWMNA